MLELVLERLPLDKGVGGISKLSPSFLIKLQKSLTPLYKKYPKLLTLVPKIDKICNKNGVNSDFPRINL